MKLKFSNDSDMVNKCVEMVRILGRRSSGREVAEDLQEQGYKITIWMASHILQDDSRIKTEEMGGRYLFTVR